MCRCQCLIAWAHLEEVTEAECACLAGVCGTRQGVGQIYSSLNFGKCGGKPLATSQRLFYLLCGEMIGKVRIKVEAIRRQLGVMMEAETSIMGSRLLRHLPRSVSLTGGATCPSPISEAS